MPYSQEELQANEHYTSIKNRDEVKYQQDFVTTKNKWLNFEAPLPTEFKKMLNLLNKLDG